MSCGSLKKMTFNLSEKSRIHPRYDTLECIMTDDVKEFIRLRNKLDEEFLKGDMTYDEYLNRRNKLAGEKLSGVTSE